MFTGYLPATQASRKTKTNLSSLKMNTLTVYKRSKTTHRGNRWKVCQMELIVQWKALKRYASAIPNKNIKGSHLWLGIRQQRTSWERLCTNNSRYLRGNMICIAKKALSRLAIKWHSSSRMIIYMKKALSIIRISNFSLCVTSQHSTSVQKSTQTKDKTKIIKIR